MSNKNTKLNLAVKMILTFPGKRKIEFLLIFQKGKITKIINEKYFQEVKF